MSHTKTHSEEILMIEGIKESVIVDYFATINREEFELTAALFTPEGKLLAPFEKPIIGQEAIALYLTKEAKGMKLLPLQGTSEPAEDNSTLIIVTGKVQTSLFKVNVAWHFNFNQQKITTAQIKLLASPQELLGLKQKRNDDPCLDAADN